MEDTSRPETPRKRTVLELSADRPLLAAGRRNARFLLVRLQAPAAREESARPAVNLSFVVDRSGSMHGDKLRLAKEATLTAIHSLRERDRFSVVAYDDRIDVLVAARAATAGDRRDAEDAVRRTFARGMTDLCGGWEAGCEQIGVSRHDGAVGRCLLLSDGLANRGVTNHEDIVGRARELAARGVETSTFGVGRDFDESLLGDMAAAGGGNFYYVEAAAQIPDFIASEVGEALETAATGVRLVLDLPEGVRVRTLNELDTVQEGTRATVAVGTMVSEQALEIVVMLDFPAATVGERAAVAVSVRDDDDAFSAVTATAEFTHVEEPQAAGQTRTRDADYAAAQLSAALARRSALAFHDHGLFTEAQEALRSTAEQILAYESDDPRLREIIDELVRIDPDFGREMSIILKKLHYTQSWHGLRGRDARGRAKREFD